MALAVPLCTDYSAAELRRLTATSRHANRSRRLLSPAAVLEGMNRTEAARIGGMDRQTLRDWVHQFNEHGPDGLKDHRANGSAPRLSKAQLAELAPIVEQRFGVVYQKRTIGKVLKQIGFSHVGARPRHPNWLSNRIFETYDDIVDGAGDAWSRLIATPHALTSIGMRKWAHTGQR